LGPVTQSAVARQMSLPGRYVRNAVARWKASGPKGLAEIAVVKLWPALSPVAYKSLRMRLHLGYWPNIRNPRTFNEKIAHRQLFAPNPLASLVADKWRVREYVAERGLAHILNEVYFVTDAPETIPFDDLPDRFVTKANHGSGWNIIAKDKSKLDRQEVIRQCREWLSLKYGKATRSYESHYDSIQPVILVEKLLEDRDGRVPLDYKFFCFHGRAQYVVAIDRSASPTLNCYDREWQDMGFRMSYPIGKTVPKPALFDRMIEVAESLSVGFDFVRVDLYTPDSEIILFGEITVNSGGGLAKFTPRKWDFRFGELW